MSTSSLADGVLESTSHALGGAEEEHNHCRTHAWGLTLSRKVGSSYSRSNVCGYVGGVRRPLYGFAARKGEHTRQMVGIKSQAVICHGVEVAILRNALWFTTGGPLLFTCLLAFVILRTVGTL